MHLTDRMKLYLNCIDDWKAPYEVAQLLGDTPVPKTWIVSRSLGMLKYKGLAEWHAGNNTYRVSGHGLVALGRPARS